MCIYSLHIRTLWSILYEYVYMHTPIHFIHIQLSFFERIGQMSWNCWYTMLPWAVGSGISLLLSFRVARARAAREERQQKKFTVIHFSNKVMWTRFNHLWRSVSLRSHIAVQGAATPLQGWEWLASVTLTCYLSTGMNILTHIDISIFISMSFWLFLTTFSTFLHRKMYITGKLPNMWNSLYRWHKLITFDEINNTPAFHHSFRKF